MSYGSLILNGASSETSSFSVSLSCSTRAMTHLGGQSGIVVGHTKKFERISPSANPMGRAKSFISNYAGCSEASIVRLRSIALARMKPSISGVEFRFRLPS